MGLLTPTPGEVTDRIQILHLKIAASVTKGKDATHFAREQNALNVYYRNFKALEKEDGFKFNSACDALADVNKTLWDLEDSRRVLINCTQMDVVEVAQNAYKTTRLNDHRSKLIKDINALYGITAEEKLY